MFEIYQNSLSNWHKTGVTIQGRVEEVPPSPATGWEETYSIGEIPANDSWNTAATEFKKWQEDLYVSWGHQKESTRHYMCFNPELDFNFDRIFNVIGCSESNSLCNFMKLPTGNLIPWHCDTYGYFVKKSSVPADQIVNIKRSVLFIEDWSFGQVIQFGSEVLSNWKAGELYSWNHDTWHGAANFGGKDLTFMQITYYE